MHIRFFLGKGGTGKSTMACVQAAKDSLTGNTVLVSLDPAHNLSDILNVKLGHRLKKVAPGLRAVEVDERKMIKEYLKDLSMSMKRSYAYQSAFNLQKYFDIITSSPAIDEYALLLAFEKILNKHHNAYSLIFDMPPTALSLKFFRLPGVSLKWLSHLKKMREDILKKKEIITRVKFGKATYEKDKILNKIINMSERYEKINELFRAKSPVSVIPVLNNDALSKSETVYILRELHEAGIHPPYLLLNKAVESETDISPHFGIPVEKFPLLEKFPCGIVELMKVQGFTSFGI